MPDREWTEMNESIISSHMCMPFDVETKEKEKNRVNDTHRHTQTPKTFKRNCVKLWTFNSSNNRMVFSLFGLKINKITIVKWNKQINKGKNRNVYNYFVLFHFVEMNGHHPMVLKCWNYYLSFSGSLRLCVSYSLTLSLTYSLTLFCNTYVEFVISLAQPRSVCLSLSYTIN